MFHKSIMYKLIVPVSLLFSTSILALDCNQSTECPKDLIKLHKLANEGIPEAQIMMGYFHLEGIFVDKNNEHAFTWFKKGTEHERVIADAHHMVGLYYLDGKVVEKDFKKGYEHIQIAGTAGKTSSQVMMGKLFYDDKDVPRDLKKARAWFELAAKQSNPLGAYYAAKLAAVGAGGKKSISNARKWYLIAAKHDIKDSRERLAKLDSSIEFDTRLAEVSNEVESISDQELVSQSLAKIERLMTLGKLTYHTDYHYQGSMLYNGGNRYNNFKNTSLDFGFSDGSRFPRVKKSNR